MTQLLYLHGMDGLLFSDPLRGELRRSFEVHAPEHPGWSAEPRSAHLRTIDDLAYGYLDLIDELSAAGPVLLVGVSLGAWLAAEAATKSCTGVAGLVLVAPIGVRTGPPTLRRYLDIYATPRDDVLSAWYGDPAAAPDLSSLTDEQFEQLARAQEATAYFAWEPYMHSPGLVERLHRISVPTLMVRPEQDGFVLDDHAASTFAEHLPHSESITVPARGHRVEELAPQELAAAITGFARKI